MRRGFLEKNIILLFLILAAALFVRLWGIGFNLPYIENSDERAGVVNPALYIAETGDLEGFHFAYPPLHTYIQAIAIYLDSKVLHVPPKLIPTSQLYLLCRVIVALLGTLTIYIVYLIGKSAYDKNTGLMAAALLAGTFVHAVYSQQVKMDVPATFFGTISLLFAINVVRKPKFRNYGLSGIFVGLAGATHYNGVFFIVPLLTAHIISQYQMKHRVTRSMITSPKLLLGIMGVFVGFLMGYPTLLLDPLRFFHRLKQTYYGLSLQSIIGPPAWIWYIRYLWHYGLYYPLFLASVGGILLAFRRLHKASIVILSFILTYGIWIFSNSVHYTDRLSIPLTSILALLSAFFLISVCNKMKKGKVIGVSLLVVLVGLLLLRIAIGDFYRTKPSPLQALEVWMDSNVPRRSRILFTAGKLCFSPNNLEKKYNVNYYYPELTQHPADSLSLSYNYIILYWGSHLPASWQSEIAQKALSAKEFLSPIPSSLPLNSLVTKVSNPYLIVRGGGGDKAVLYRLKSKPVNNYGIVKNISLQKGNLKGYFQFVPGSNLKSRTEFIYSTDLTLTTADGAEKTEEHFKPFEEATDYQFILHLDTRQVELFSSAGEQIEDKEDLKEDLRKGLSTRFNLESLVWGQFLGQDGKDFCSRADPPHPSGIEDIHIILEGVKKQVKRVVVNTEKSVWMGPFNGAYPAIYFEQNGNKVDLYFEPIDHTEGIRYNICLFYNDGSMSLIYVNGEK